MTIQKQPFEDVFPIQKSFLFFCHVNFRGCTVFNHPDHFRNLKHRMWTSTGWLQPNLDQYPVINIVFNCYYSYSDIPKDLDPMETPFTGVGCWHLCPGEHGSFEFPMSSRGSQKRQPLQLGGWHGFASECYIFFKNSFMKSKIMEPEITWVMKWFGSWFEMIWFMK